MAPAKKNPKVKKKTKQSQHKKVQSRKRQHQPKKKREKKYTLNVLSLFLLVIVSAVFINFCVDVFYIQDDAYITFRYIENLLDGNGLVFNPGERVEGYTNFLWLVVLTGFRIFQFNLADIAQYLSTSLGVVILFITYFLGRQIKVRSEEKTPVKAFNFQEYINIFAPVLLALTGAFAFWSVSGMETTLFISLSLLGIYYYIANKDKEKPNYAFVIPVLLASYTRPEGLMVFGLIYLHKIFFIVKDKIRKDFAGAVKDIFTPVNIRELAVFIIPTVFYILFRLVYYGYPFPNTFYAKTGFSTEYLSQGIDYFVSFAKAYMFHGIVMLLPLYLLTKKKYRFEFSLYYLLIIVYVVYVIAIGGDVLPAHRFFLPILPLIYIAFAKFLGEMLEVYKEKKKTSSPASVFILFLAMVIGLGYYNYDNQKPHIEYKRNQEIGFIYKMIQKAKWLKLQQSLSDKPIIAATTTIGAISYFSGVVIVDMLGLTDETIAHHPVEIKEISEYKDVPWKERNYNAEYLLSRKPDHILFSTDIKPSAFAERAAFVQPEFIFNYYLNIVYMPSVQRYMFLYSRKDQNYINQTDSAVFYEDYDLTYVHHFVNMANHFSAFTKSKDQAKLINIQEEYDEVQKRAPSQFNAHNILMSQTHMINGNMDKGVEYLQMVIQNDPLHPMAHFYMYQYYMITKDREKALYHYQKCSRYAPYAFPGSWSG